MPLISHKNYIGREFSFGPEFEPVYKPVSEQFPESLERSQQRRKNQLIFWKYSFCDETRKVCEIDIDPIFTAKIIYFTARLIMSRLN